MNDEINRLDMEIQDLESVIAEKKDKLTIHKAAMAVEEATEAHLNEAKEAAAKIAEEESKAKAIENEQQKKVLLSDLESLKKEMEPRLNEIKGLQAQLAELQATIDSKEAKLNPHKEAISRIEDKLKTLEE